jgi:hypothetical protein
MITIIFLALCVACIWATLAAIAVKIAFLAPAGVPVVFIVAFIVSLMMLLVNCVTTADDDD